MVLSLSGVFETQRVKFIPTRTDVRHLPSLCARGLAETTRRRVVFRDQPVVPVTRDPTRGEQTIRRRDCVFSCLSLRSKTETDAEPSRQLLYFGDSRRTSVAVEC